MSVIDFTDEKFREVTIGKKAKCDGDIVDSTDEKFQRDAIINEAQSIQPTTPWPRGEKNHVCDMSLIGGVKLTPITISKISADKISALCDELKRFLLVKNERYGDSALNPVKIFSKGNADDKIDTRMDDKLSRISESEEQRKNDFVDLTGYLVLKCIEKGWIDFSDLLD